MLDKLINKFRQLFDSKEELEFDYEDNVPLFRRRTKPVEAKVSYQYPKKQSFRFPMPIDPPPVYDKQDEIDSWIETDDPKTDEVKKRKPFKASNVASPIHGFHTIDRMETSHLEEPAFLRRDREKLLKDKVVKQEVNKQTIEKQDEVMEETTVIKPSQETDYPEIQDTIEQENITDSYQEQVESQIPSNNIPEEQIEQVSEQVTDRRESARKHPFNVIMTPSDKRRYREKRQQVIEQKDHLPSLHLLNDLSSTVQQDQAWIEEQSKKLTETLAEFNVKAHVVNAMQGPTVTRFEIQPESGVKVSKVRNLSDDIKLNMAAKDIRIEAPIPGKNAIGIEIPNEFASPVGLYEIFKTRQFSQAESPLTIGLGLDISGNPVVTDIKRMPHGLIAGATGSGKSVCINSILISLLYKASPRDVRLLLIDPKMVELAPYNDIPHLVSPVITDIKAATQALRWAVEEMESRYHKFANVGARNIERYNQKMAEENNEQEKMSYLVIVIDELADLMMIAPQDVEDSISRIAQKARACGIHLLLATQRPSVDVITGLIKANIPTRIAFSVASQVDSRTMIDQNGAERLLGKGDMLFVENGARYPMRIQGAFVSDEEIDRVTNDARKREAVDYLFEQEDLLQRVEQEDNEDELYDEAVAFVLDHNGASTSLLQRRFKIGYNRAARLIDALEYNGIISGQNGSKPRTLLVTKEELEQLQ
ncbi:DNA translocase FtsK [Amphibacillus sp. MSJ-3]|uniref:DNA translocase FtsK n=1 Tax=Amphibacillus sp. MSJ-3 TaxID=2841505 RepID=UPI001C0ED3FB|nr:DNA translocase FtsK [Amphibacillus sp. MSJ-3]MBU5593700.1 DNA translocase FtsK [Amphibacillus sp. MSJ-3]